MTPTAPPLNRRRFLRNSALAAAAGPFIGTARAAAAEKIEVGFMGLNSRGSDLIKEFLATGRVTVSWLCDVDRQAVEKAGKIVAEKQVRAFKTAADVRRLLDDRRLQAIVIAAPDHWHAPAAILAMKAGKAVYVEKPLSHNPREGEVLVEVQRRTSQIVQVGLQRRSVPWVAEALQRVRSGEIGAVHFARAWYANKRTGIGFGQLANVPDSLDFDLWQGPAPERPYRDNIVHYNWHWFWHWGTGELGNNGVHFLDLARWGLDTECPVRVTSGGGRYFFDDDQETPDTQSVTYDFGDKSIVWEHRSCHPRGIDGDDAGVAFYGRNATLVIGGAGYRILDPAGKELARVDGPTPTAPHVANFLDCIQNRARKPAASAVDGHKSTLLCHLGNIAQRSNGAIELNPKTWQLRNQPAATRFWSREYRNGWEPAA